MKFTDILNESNLTPIEQKMLKKAKAVFTVLKKGTITVRHPRSDEFIKFIYKFHDNEHYGWDIVQRDKFLTISTPNDEGLTIYTDDEKIFDWCTNDIYNISSNPTGVFLRTTIRDSISNKFENFGVRIHVNDNGMNFELDKPEQPINESYTDDIITDKERKKAKIVYNAFKNGTFTIGGDTKIRYELNNGYDLMMGDYGARIIKLKDELFSEKRFMSVYLIHDDGHETYVDISKGNTIYRAVLTRLSERFQQFNFHITY